MNKVLKKIVDKYGNVFCVLAACIVPVVSQGCYWKFYQPKEPDGLKELLKYEK